MKVWVVVARREAQEVIAVDLPEGATLAQALDAAGLFVDHSRPDLAGFGIWGRPRDPSTFLRAGDRVERYRSIRADAKALRRARAQDAGLHPRGKGSGRR